MFSIPEEHLTEEQRVALEKYLHELATMESDKVDNFGQFLKIQTTLAEACKKEGQRLTSKSKTIENGIHWLKNKYVETMRRYNITETSCSVYTLKVTEKLSVVVTMQLEKVPDIYKCTKTTMEPDKQAIREALTAGIEAPGCTFGISYGLKIC